MDKDVEEFVNWFVNKEDKDANYISIWEIAELPDNPIEKKTLEKIFTPEQLAVLWTILKKMLWLVDDWHNKDDEESHKDLREELKKLDAKLRNHRHETGKTFSAKPEF